MQIFIRAFFICNIWTLVLIGVYIVFSRRNAKQKKMNVDMVKIQDL